MRKRSAWVFAGGGGAPVEREVEVKSADDDGEINSPPWLETEDKDGLDKRD